MSRVGILLHRGTRTQQSTPAAENEQKGTWPVKFSSSEPGIAVQASRPGTHAVEHSRSGARTQRYMTSFSEPGFPGEQAEHARSGARTQRSMNATELACSGARTQQSMHAAEFHLTEYNT